LPNYELDILHRLYGEIYTTNIVAEEFGESIPDWITLIDPQDEQKQRLLELQIDKGEASALNLALEISADLVILDDFKARRIAEKLGLQITGTLGVIIKAKQERILESAKPIIEKLQNTDFRISESLIKEALLLAKEN